MFRSYDHHHVENYEGGGEPVLPKKTYSMSVHVRQTDLRAEIRLPVLWLPNVTDDVLAYIPKPETILNNTKKRKHCQV
jgi:hypothetical protein